VRLSTRHSLRPLMRVSFAKLGRDQRRENVEAYLYNVIPGHRLAIGRLG